jgi:hypothetical protein
MAFVSIDNPAGIQHHGGQMDWCRISPTRIAIVTFTVDNKALVQEANYADGVTTLGPASYLKQVALRLPSPQNTYLKPRIRSMGNDRLFIMVPSSFIALTAANGIARLYGTAEYSTLNSTIDVPYTHTCIVAVRNPDGTYTVDSQIDTRTQSIAEGNIYPTYNGPLDIDINPNGLQIVISQTGAANNVNQRMIMKNTLTLVNGEITAQAVTVAQVGVSQPQGNLAMAVREVLSPQLVPHRIYAYSTNYATSWAASQNSATTNIYREYWNINGGVADVWPALSANINGNHLNINAYLPIDIAARTFFYTGANNSALAGNCYVNSNLTNAGVMILNPLDSAWVTDKVACIIGQDNVYPPDAARPCFDGDAAYSLNPAYHAAPFNSNSQVRQLSLAFKSVEGAGVYVGPFDPIKTQYYTKDYFNIGPIIHRIDDTAFWMIGCFREGADGTDKLGVITVKA